MRCNDTKPLPADSIYHRDAHQLGAYFPREPAGENSLLIFVA
jgi:hypothetical protein